MYRLIVFLFVTSLLNAQTQNLLGDVVIDGGRGDVPVYVPSSYDPTQATPLVMLLHGYTGTGPHEPCFHRKRFTGQTRCDAK